MSVKTFIRNLLEDLGNGIMYCCSWAQVEQVMRIVSFALSILISCLIVVSRLHAWWVKAKADGKITKDEIDEAVKIVSEGGKEIKQHVDSHTKGGKNE